MGRVEFLELILLLNSKEGSIYIFFYSWWTRWLWFFYWFSSWW